MFHLLQRTTMSDVQMSVLNSGPVPRPDGSSRNWSTTARRFFASLAITSLAVSALTAAPAAAEEPDGLRAAVLAEMAEHLKLSELADEDVKQVFAVRFFSTAVEWQGSWVHHIFAWGDGKAYPLVFEGSTMSGESLIGALKPDFRIRGEEDLKVLRAGMAKVLRFEDLEPDTPKFGTYRGKWAIIGGTFFDHFSGYILDIDDDGKPVGLLRELEIKRDELK